MKTEKTFLDKNEKSELMTEIKTLKETNSSQEIFLQEVFTSIEQMEKKLEEKNLENKKILQSMVNLKSENEELQAKTIQIQNSARLLALEKQELLENMNGDITSRTGKTLNKEIQQLETKFKDFEEKIEELEDEKAYQIFIFEQAEENAKHLRNQNFLFISKLKQLMALHKGLIEENRKYEQAAILDSEKNDKLISDQNSLITMLEDLKKTIDKNYLKRGSFSINTDSKVLKENNYS